jgi:hypothetical protein
MNPDEAWDFITSLLEDLTDKQLSNIILVIREIQLEREDEKIEASTVR